ncbi:MAG: cytochrome c nitrite reductase membrane subunit NrfH [Ignavibacteria bacterium]|nr:MAG: cytochrome c nitrite reductase membrane subunit NrfH [Ignavibacteria bacterium]KAF0156674.1 MAG: cytochrome c nitrite reductase membrane subunit NrfH [Ignavibacteria bacterium]
MEDSQSGRTNFLKKLVFKIIPPDRWRVPVLITFGIFFGLGFYIVYISNAASYLSDNPKTCVNCHVMTPQYATWERGSHGKVATCNDCHVPQDNLIRKYWFKANDGLRHATYFTMRWEPQVIRIKQAGKDAVQENCIRCHSNLIHPVALRAINNRNVQDQTEKYCWDCHRETPHGRVHSLSSTPHAIVPQLKPVVPEWLEKITN